MGMFRLLIKVYEGDPFIQLSLAPLMFGANRVITHKSTRFYPFYVSRGIGKVNLDVKSQD